MVRLRAAIVGLSLCAACGESDARTDRVVTERPAPAPPPQQIIPTTSLREVFEERSSFVPSAFETMLGSPYTFGDLEARLEEAPSTRLKPVGTSSIVFQMRLQGDVDAAYRPRMRSQPRGYLAEIAAYRIARMLGMTNVPPVVTRYLYRVRLEEQLDDRFVDRLHDLVMEIDWERDARGAEIVPGAAIYWIPQMREIGIDHEPRISQWTAALAQTEPEPEQNRELYADLGTMVAYDYLIGNPDRFSGHNAKGTIAGHRMFVRDHNMAFGVPIPRANEERMLHGLERAQRFSRSFVERLVSLDEDSLLEELERDPGAERGLALEGTQIRELLARRATLVSYIESLVDAYGVERILAFP